MGEVYRREKPRKDFAKRLEVLDSAGAYSLSISQNQKESERAGSKFALGRGVGVPTAPPTRWTEELQLADAAGDAASGVLSRHWPEGQPITGEKWEAEMLAPCMISAPEDQWSGARARCMMQELIRNLSISINFKYPPCPLCGSVA